MNTYIKLFAIFLAFAAISACTTQVPELKSPCVGIEGSPCERRSPLLNQQA